MKNILIILIIASSIIVSCTGVKSVSKGLENQAFIELIGNPDKYHSGVDVVLDDKTFKAEVVEAGMKRPKGTIYAISTGKHVLKIKHNNKIIYSKQIFVSAQETKQIVLP